MYYANANAQKIADSAGTVFTVLRYKPVFTLGTKTILELQIIDNSGSPVELNSSDTFTFALDNNFIHTDDLMAYSTAVTIADAENGIIQITVDSNTVSFETKLNGAEQITAWLEVSRYIAGSTDPEIIVQDQCTCRNRVQTTENEPSSSEVEYLTAAQIEALIASGVNIQFSADAADWHSAQDMGDIYIRFQFAAGTGSVWSAPINMPKIAEIGLAACSGLGEYLAENAFTMTWIDPDDVTLNGATLAEWNQTVLVRKVGSYPADQTDGTVLATTSRALGNKNAYRSNGFTDSSRESGTTYYYKLFSQTTAGVWNNLTGNQFVENTDMSWGMIQSFVRAGRGPDLFPVGTVFEVEHPEYTVDGHGIYFRVVGHDQVPAADETLTHTMCLDMVDCLFSAPYDNAEMEYGLTADITAKAAKTYYKFENNAYTALVEGTDYEIGDPVPAITWYEKNTGTKSTRGNTAFAESNLLQWANSAGDANSWFVQKNIWDVCSATLLGKNGFLKYLDPEFLSIVHPAALTTRIPTVDGDGYTVVSAKFWPLSSTQIFGFQHENILLQWYSEGGSPVKHQTGQSSSVIWLTRSSYDGSESSILYMNTSGSSGMANASNSMMISLACIIA